MIVVWRITEVCNLSCGFCAYDRRRSIARRSAEVEQVQRIGQAFSRWQSVSGDQVLVSWLGGEPLLWKPLERLTRLFTQELGLRVSTTTNGTTLYLPATRRHLLEHYKEVTVSVDALGESHDALRGRPGLYSELGDSVRALAREKAERGAPLKLRANVVLMNQTFSTFPKLCRELAEWGIEEISFNVLGGRDRPEFFRDHRVLPAQAESLETQIPLLRTELKTCGVTLLGSEDYLRRITASSLGKPIQVENCHPGESFLFIDERGRISPCSFTSDVYGIPFDELVGDNPIADLPELFRAARRRVRSSACEDCMSTHVFTKFAVTHGS